LCTISSAGDKIDKSKIAAKKTLYDDAIYNIGCREEVEIISSFYADKKCKLF
jgi:hypothetical protein